MKNISLVLVGIILLFVSGKLFGQNSPLLIWGTGLDGSTYQTTAIYSDVNYGLLFEAPKDAGGNKLPITFNWRGGGVSPLFINPNGNVGIGLNSPSQKLTVSGGNISIDTYGNWIGVASPSSNERTYARILGTDIANAVDKAVLTSNGFVNTSDNSLIQDNSNLPTWALTLDANNDGFYVKRAANGSTSGSDLTVLMTVNNSGNVGIGTTTPQATLDVNGSIRSKEVKVTALNATDVNVEGNVETMTLKINGDVPKSDYVFEKDYTLRSLEDVEAFVTKNKHLPEVPSATEFEENGYSVGQMDDILLRKVEELTLYVIELKKENLEQQKQIQELKEGKSQNK